MDPRYFILIESAFSEIIALRLDPEYLEKKRTASTENFISNYSNGLVNLHVTQMRRVIANLPEYTRLAKYLNDARSLCRNPMADFICKIRMLRSDLPWLSEKEKEVVSKLQSELLTVSSKLASDVRVLIAIRAAQNVQTMKAESMRGIDCLRIRSDMMEIVGNICGAPRPESRLLTREWWDSDVLKYHVPAKAPTQTKALQEAYQSLAEQLPTIGTQAIDMEVDFAISAGESQFHSRSGDHPISAEECDELRMGGLDRVAYLLGVEPAPLDFEGRRIWEDNLFNYYVPKLIPSKTEAVQAYHQKFIERGAFKMEEKTPESERRLQLFNEFKREQSNQVEAATTVALNYLHLTQAQYGPVIGHLGDSISLGLVDLVGQILTKEEGPQNFESRKEWQENLWKRWVPYIVPNQVRKLHMTAQEFKNAGTLFELTPDLPAARARLERYNLEKHRNASKGINPSIGL